MNKSKSIKNKINWSAFFDFLIKPETTPKTPMEEIMGSELLSDETKKQLAETLNSIDKKTEKLSNSNKKNNTNRINVAQSSKIKKSKTKVSNEKERDEK